MQTQVANKTYTPEEYLALEEQAEEKHEYQDGEIIEMAGASTNHNRIAGNFYRKFPLEINGQDYESYIGDVRLWMPEYRIYTYPDIMVVKGEPIYYEDSTSTILNPFLVVEVLSGSTKNYDKGDKFFYYRSIPYLKEYLLIAQDSFYIEQFSKKDEGKWLFTEHKVEDAVLRLESVEFEISLKEIYKRVNFE